MNKGMYSSDKKDWETPPDLFEYFNSLYDFELDVCANEHNAKLPSYFDQNSLQLVWGTRNWMNPPYGREISKWVEKASREHITVALLPARTDTRWFQDYVLGQTIYWIRGRLKFVGAENSAPFPSCVVIFGEEGKQYKLAKVGGIWSAKSF